MQAVESTRVTFELLGVKAAPKVRDVLFMLILNKENSYCFHYPISLIAYFKCLCFFCSSFPLSTLDTIIRNGNLLKLWTDSHEKVI